MTPLSGRGNCVDDGIMYRARKLHERSRFRAEKDDEFLFGSLELKELRYTSVEIPSW